MSAQLHYSEIFNKLCKSLIQQAPTSTKETTKAIKKYFRDSYAPLYHVLCSDTESSEYGIDVLVTSFKPKELIAKTTLNLNITSVNVLLAVESELGGVSASSAYGVMRNVAEDYLKLLITRCEKRIMIFTSLPYKGESKHIENRVEKLRELYALVPELKSGVLLVHLYGKNVNSSQVQTVVTKESIRGFIIASDGKTTTEIPAI